MKKRTIPGRFLSLVLVLVLCLSTPLTALAAETDQTLVETTAGNYEAVDVVITIQDVTNTDGSVSGQMTAQADGYVTENGLTVDYTASGNALTTVDGVTTGETQSEYSVTNATGTYGAEGGTELTVTPAAPEVTVELSLTDDAPNNQNTATTQDPEGTSVLTGDAKENEADGTYDYTVTTVEQQGSVTLTTTEVTVTESTDASYTQMDYIHSTAEASAENDLIHVDTDHTEPLDPDSLDVAEGYTHIYLGADNYSVFGAALVCREGAEGEEPVFVIDGAPYYVQGNHSVFEKRKLYVDDYYIDGQHVDEKTYARWDYIQQFTFVDAQTGELITTYCADQKTAAQEGYSYIMVNVDDATYYQQEQADMIRTVAQNGYWGTDTGFGSLDTMKENLAATGEFTREELDALTDGMAMTATQYAIWTFSNISNGDAYVNTYYVSQSLGIGRVPEEEKASVELIFKLYNHLINLEPTVTENTTADTIINPDNFLESASITVVGKADDHPNNQDADTTNDAYVTDLTFALVVTPKSENDDDLVVEVFDKDGNLLAHGRIAGTPVPGETFLTPDAEGNYSFTDIVLTEGNQSFHITLEGIQNLQEGVYLYTSEVREDVSSQTMVGIASGPRDVNVSMNISFELTVEDEIVAQQRVWRTEWTKPSGNNPPVDPEDPPVKPEEPPVDPEIPPEEPGEVVPPAQPPKTGDTTWIYTLLSAISGLCLAVLQLFRRRKKGDPGGSSDSATDAHAESKAKAPRRTFRLAAAHSGLQLFTGHRMKFRRKPPKTIPVS